jgi:hypothetical protein
MLAPYFSFVWLHTEIRFLKKTASVQRENGYRQIIRQNRVRNDLVLQTKTCGERDFVSEGLAQIPERIRNR